MAEWQPPARGALDDTPWPDKLVARAIDPTPADARLHGYRVLGDLARHYEHSDMLYLAITGELPDEPSSRLFRIALACFAPLSVNHAPTHVAVLSRICGGALASALGAGIVAAADRARSLVEHHRALIAWLADPRDAPPATYVDVDSDWLTALRDAVPQPIGALRLPWTHDAAGIVVLHASGLRVADQIEAAIVSASAIGVIAEALQAGPDDLRRYPVKLPPFHYVDGNGG